MHKRTKKHWMLKKAVCIIDKKGENINAKCKLLSNDGKSIVADMW